MLEHAELAAEFICGIDRVDFDTDREKQFAVVRALEVVGEAAKGVDAAVRELAPGIPWRQLTAMRDKLIHHYFGVDLEIVWQTVTLDIPTLIAELRELMRKAGAE